MIFAYIDFDGNEFYGSGITEQQAFEFLKENWEKEFDLGDLNVTAVSFWNAVRLPTRVKITYTFHDTLNSPKLVDQRRSVEELEGK